MCGIVGYIGDRQAQDVLLDGLARLEYRGYDSAGVAILGDKGLAITKKQGGIENLINEVKNNLLSGKLGIGHTRWATHGVPSDENAHPHYSNNGKLAVVHNGIIENYITLRNELQEKGYQFTSDTDTEVIVHLVESLYNGNLVATLKKVIKRISGSYALGLISADEPDLLVAIRKDSPLIVGLGKSENFIASDITAILNYTKDVYLLDDNEIAIVKKDSIKILDQTGNSVKKELLRVDWDPGDAEKGGYDYFMMKEMMDQPKAIRDVLTGRCFEKGIKFNNINLNEEAIKNINRIQIVACGTAYHAGMVGKYYFEKLARVHVETETASEFRYNNPIIDEHTLLIVISQSGETADTLAALRLAKAKGARILAVTNVVGSTISREVHDVIYTNAGPEIAVASTKAYVTQLACMLMLAAHIGKLNGKLNQADQEKICTGLIKTEEQINKAFAWKETIRAFAEKNKDIEHMFYIGRGLDYYACLEGSLKLKEISYIHSEAYPAGELKHGAIALIEVGTIVLAICTQKKVFEKMLSNIKEVKARGAYVLAIVQEEHKDIESEVDEVWVIPNMDDDITPIPTTVYLQLLAYYLADARGSNVDKPRNLAKSVTVE